MRDIHLQQILPQVFAVSDNLISDLWRNDITISRGEYMLIEAASGTGKSSLCSYLYGSRFDYQGDILFDEINIRKFSVSEWVRLRSNSLSMMFQDLRLFPELTVMENIMIKNKLTKHKSISEIKAMLEAMGIAEKCDGLVAKLSFGQQQRVAFIRALCQPFDFILLDEPVSHLDTTNSAIMSELLQREANRLGAGVIVTSIGRHLELPYNRIVSL